MMMNWSETCTKGSSIVTTVRRYMGMGERRRPFRREFLFFSFFLKEFAVATSLHFDGTDEEKKKKKKKKKRDTT